jgi:bifunctional non-homologous end joining protein LigD
MPTDKPEVILAEVEGRTVRVTHMDKVLFPDDGITKAEVLQYYLSAAPFLLPHVRGRPLTLKAFPHGIMGRPYYRRNLADSTPAWVSRVQLDEGPGPVIRNLADLVWVVNLDSIELHPWLSREDDLTHPDLVVFDLDPGPNLPLPRLCEAAVVVRDTLRQMGLECYPKTSGSKGIHLLIGIEPAYDFDEARAWVMAVARVLASHRPDLLTAGYSRPERVNRVLLDYNQVGWGRTTASIYSVRPYKGGPISAPLTWAEVEGAKIAPDAITIRNIQERLAKGGDAASGLLKSSQKLPHL